MKKFLYVLIFAIFIPLNGCATILNDKGYAPSIEFHNLSNKKIINPKCNWVEINVSQLRLFPGKSAVEVHYLKNIDDFYGTVHLTWENEAGKKFEKMFEFTENDLPIEDRITYYPNDAVRSKGYKYL